MEHSTIFIRYNIKQINSQIWGLVKSHQTSFAQECWLNPGRSDSTNGREKHSGRLFQNTLILRKIELSSNSLRCGECTSYLKHTISSQLGSYASINSLLLSPTLSLHTWIDIYKLDIQHIFFQLKSTVWSGVI